MVNTDSSNKPPTRMEALEHRVGFIEGAFNALRGHHQEMEEDLSDVKKQANEFSRSTDERFKKTDERMDVLDGRVTDAQYTADMAQGKADSAYDLGYSAHARITNTNNNLKIIGSMGSALLGTFALFKYVIPGIQEVLTYNYCRISANLTSPTCLDYNIAHLTEQGIQPSENYVIGQLSLLVFGAAVLIGGYYLNMKKRDNKMLDQAINS